jgi:hypothetical protein
VSAATEGVVVSMAEGHARRFRVAPSGVRKCNGRAIAVRRGSHESDRSWIGRQRPAAWRDLVRRSAHRADTGRFDAPSTSVPSARILAWPRFGPPRHLRRSATYCGRSGHDDHFTAEGPAAAALPPLRLCSRRLLGTTPAVQLSIRLRSTALSLRHRRQKTPAARDNQPYRA